MPNSNRVCATCACNQNEKCVAMPIDNTWDDEWGNEKYCPYWVPNTFDFETAVVREWKGYWEGNIDLPTFPPGGYVFTFHKGFSLPYKIEHYDTVEEIVEKYQNRYYFMPPDPRDKKDIVLVGI